MKILKRALTAAAIALVGCTSSPPIIVTQAVGPSAVHHAAWKGEGQLVVFTAMDNADPAAYYPTHTPYRVYSDNGSLLRRVDIRSGSFYQDPSTVQLPAGRYRVEARATNTGTVIFPVLVEENKTTVVDLDGATLPQKAPIGAGQWVRLPDGKVIGLRAN